MCSIFGLGFMSGHEVQDTPAMHSLMKELFEECMARGGDASGLAFVKKSKISVVKKNVNATEFLLLPETIKALNDNVDMNVFDDNDRLLSVIGHCRFETKGTRRNNANNHPIVRDSVVGVHNGHISNDDALFSRHNNSFKRNAQVDSEIIFALVEHYAKFIPMPIAVKRAATELSGGMACCLAHKLRPDVVWFFRNNSPCTIYHYPDVGMLMWASLPMFIERAIKKSGSRDMLGEHVEINFPSNSGISIDLKSNNISKFNLY